MSMKRSLQILPVLPLSVLALLLAALLLINTYFLTVSSGSGPLVTKTADTNDGVCDADCSLREAIAAAVSGENIEVPPGVYSLTMGTELVIATSLSLTGAGSGDTMTQAASSFAEATSRVFNITGGPVAISDVTIWNVNSSADGGGIDNSGTLTLTRSSVDGNTARTGGGISNHSGTV